MPDHGAAGRRHRWFIAGLAVLLPAPLLLLWAGLPMPVTAVGVVVLAVAAMLWAALGPSWVLAVAPAADTSSAARAARAGRRVMFLAATVRLLLELISSAAYPASDDLFSHPVRTVVTTAVLAYLLGRFVEYEMRRRPPDAPTPWLFRVWPL